MAAPTQREKIKPVITVQSHILQEQMRFPGASGEFSWLLSGITLATKLIQASYSPSRAVGYSWRTWRHQCAGRGPTKA
ncbi:MAG: hypothetical protein QM703_05990 [Gemmatales bacterium]